MSDEQRQRELFEERAFNKRFLMSIRKVGQGCMTFQAVECPTKEQFVKKLSDGSYEDQTLNAMWWAWLEAVKLNGNRWTPQMKDAEDAALFRALAGRAWEFKTSFDKQGQPTMIRAVFKSTTQTSDHMAEQIRSLVHDFGKNAEAFSEGLKNDK